MKLLYLAYINYDNPSGVLFKILAQIDAFKLKGHYVNYFYIKDKNMYYLIDGQSIKISTVGDDSILTKNIFYFKILVYLHRSIVSLDFVYQRKVSSNPIMNSIFRFFKKNKVTIVQEIPTYPYRGEITKSSSLLEKTKARADLVFRKSELKYIDYIATFSNDAEIDGKETIMIDNSVNKNYNKVIPKIVDNTIRLICVSNLVFWQGYDRIIKGLKDYYEGNLSPQPLVFFDVVGEGPEKSILEDLVNEYKLNNYVQFHGFKEGDDLDRLFSDSDLAIAILGLHRKGMTQVSALKTKEYLARNIPFIYSGSERFIDEFDMVLRVESNDSPICISDLVAFRFSLNYKLNEYSKFDELANKHFTWEVQIDRIINFLESKYE